MGLLIAHIIEGWISLVNGLSFTDFRGKYQEMNWFFYKKPDGAEILLAPEPGLWYG